LVKKTVNFDDPETYHLYYGDENCSPGTILTFFPWEGIGGGHLCMGMVTQIVYSVPGNSLDFWKERFERYKVRYKEPSLRFNEQYISFEDNDGLELSLVVPSEKDDRMAWQTDEISKDVAMRGFHSVVLTLRDVKPTATILTDIFGYKFLDKEGDRHRFITDAVSNASIVDIIETPYGRPGYVAGGTTHHVAFQVQDDQLLMEFREKIAARGFHITPKIDRNYFFSLYFREPGGVLFELASANPGFSVDEKTEELGTHLKLPSQYESMRSELEKRLPSLSA
jgi:glyoxalase family protein